MSLDCYRVEGHSIFKDEESGVDEEHYHQELFIATDDHEACTVGLRWMHHNFMMLADVYNLRFIESVVISRYKIANINDDGSCATGTEMPILIWDADFGVKPDRNCATVHKLCDDLGQLRHEPAISGEDDD